jgi:hypothetical protein
MLGLKASFSKELLKSVDFVGGEGFACPGTLVAGEECKSVGTDGFGIEDGIAQTAAGTNMCSNIFSHKWIVYCFKKIQR